MGKILKFRFEVIGSWLNFITGFHHDIAELDSQRNILTKFKFFHLSGMDKIQLKFLHNIFIQGHIVKDYTWIYHDIAQLDYGRNMYAKF